MAWDGLSEALPPGVETFDDPSMREKVELAFRFGDFFAALADVQNGSAHGYFVSLADIACVKTEVFNRLLFQTGGPGVQRLASPVAVVNIGSAGDERQRDTMPFDDDVSLASFPDP